MRRRPRLMTKVSAAGYRGENVDSIFGSHRRGQLGWSPVDEDPDVASEPGAGLAQAVHETGPATVECGESVADRGAIGLDHRFEGGEQR